jgi:hypothetical protein
MEETGVNGWTLTFSFELDSAVPFWPWLAENETNNCTRCAVIDATSFVVGKRGANKHPSLQARVHTENAEEYTCWAELIEIIIDGESRLHCAKRTPWEGLLVWI